MSSVLFSFEQYWQIYVGFILFVFMMLALDLGVFHRKAHAVTFKEALGWSVFWVSLSITVNIAFYFFALSELSGNSALQLVDGQTVESLSRKLAFEFFTGFVIEKSLAIDNIFVFVVLFGAFGIPTVYQHRVLFYGILGAIFFRAIFIALGTKLLAYHWALVVFGIFLIGTGVKMMFSKSAAPDPTKSKLLALFRRYFPVTNDFHGGKFWVHLNGKLVFTPLFVALLFIELSDIVFAIDSVPAIFAITSEPMIVFVSNILAILGLRSLYFLLADVVDRFIYLKFGLALVLVFVGLKMAWLNEAFGGKFPIGASLGIIAFLIGGSIVISWLRPRSKTP